MTREEIIDEAIKKKLKDIYSDKIINGDTLETLRKMPSGLFDCVVTSPPYNLGGDFHICNNGKRVSYGSYNTFSDKLSDEDYTQNQIDVLNELHRVTTSVAFCFYIHKERISKNNIISPLYWLKETNWLISQTVVLDMSATANVDKRRFFPTHEYVYVLSKSEKSKMHNEEKLTSVWKVKKTPRKISGHPATFDIQIPINCINASTKENDIVLDCYMGSGTTGVACVKTNRRYCGIELDKTYISNAIKRIDEATTIIEADKGENEDKE
jgi:DNA modification methylase